MMGLSDQPWFSPVPDKVIPGPDDSPGDFDWGTVSSARIPDDLIAMIARRDDSTDEVVIADFMGNIVRRTAPPPERYADDSPAHYTLLGLRPDEAGVVWVRALQEQSSAPPRQTFFWRVDLIEDRWDRVVSLNSDTGEVRTEVGGHTLSNARPDWVYASFIAPFPGTDQYLVSMTGGLGCVAPSRVFVGSLDGSMPQGPLPWEHFASNGEPSYVAELDVGLASDGEPLFLVQTQSVDRCGEPGNATYDLWRPGAQPEPYQVPFDRADHGS